jgi:two-component sensor histidine kinase
MARTMKSVLMPLALAIAWLSWAVIYGAGWALKSSQSVSYIVRYQTVSGLAGFFFCLALFAVYARLQKRMNFWLFALLAAALCFVTGILHQLVVGPIMVWIGTWDSYRPNLTGLLVGGGLMEGTVLASFSLIYFAVDYWRQMAEQREKAREATALAHQAQLQMLRYQLNPHFLFNALNSIRAMIVEDRDRARQMVTELADFLRYSLDGNEQESTIGDEIQAMQNYLAIQRIRFEERLDANVRVDPAAEGVVVPCFLIHPLVENAVKYGMQTSKMPLRIEVEVSREGPRLGIRVSNTGRLLDGSEDRVLRSPREGTRTGLRNIVQRLGLVFPERHTFKLSESDGWVRAEIQLQLDSRETPDETAQSADRR